MRPIAILIPILLLAACATPGPPVEPNDREWNLLMADYQWLETNRKAQPAPPPTAARKQAIELELENFRKIEPLYVNFANKVAEYRQRTGDPRASAVLAREKMVIGDAYMNILARYDKALALYREALALDPNSADARQRITIAEQRRYVTLETFANVKSGMKEEDVRRLVGLPREDWIKQVVQNNRIYSVWIYPKADGGASAVYFDNGIVYHTNWNAASPQLPAGQTK